MYLLDTNAVIDFCNGKLPENAKNLLIDIDPAISVITQIELFASVKISDSEVKTLQQFVGFCVVYDNITSDIINRTIAIRKMYRIALPDAIIAATAIVNKLTLVSRNLSDFKSIKELLIINPHSI